MVATARKVKQEHPDAKVVFVGPCASKKLEAMRTSVRSDVDFVVTFEELSAMFDAREIDPTSLRAMNLSIMPLLPDAAMQLQAVVAGAIEACLKEYYPEVPVHIEHAETLADCKKNADSCKGRQAERMYDRGYGLSGRLHGRCGNQRSLCNILQSIEEYLKDSSKKLPEKELEEIKLD